MNRRVLVRAAECAALSLIALWMAACRFLPGVAKWWMDAAALPASERLSRLSAHAPFPLLEVAALAAALVMALGLARALWRCARSRCLRPLGRFGRVATGMALALLAGYALMWYPAYFTASADVPAATDAQVAALCEALIERLNGAALSFPTVEGALREAERAACFAGGEAVPAGAVKAARYPEWMRALGAAGLYSPWTAEAIVDGGASPAALIFTGCHELMHLKGIADEGWANIAAWTACRRAGGVAAESADLWALRYAMSALRAADGAAWRACAAQMDDRLFEVFDGMNGFAGLVRREPGAVAAMAGIGGASVRYDALVGWLAGGFAQD